MGGDGAPAPKGRIMTVESYVEFPNLGLKFGISDVLFQIGHFQIKWYGLIIAVGFLLAMLYAFRRAKDFQLDSDRMIDVVLVSTLFAFVGARLYYVFFSDRVSDYLADPLSILYIWEGGLGIYGGIIFAFITAIWMCRVRKVNTLAMFDLASLGFLIGQGIGRWGNFFNQEAFGSNTDLPWGMTGNLIKQGLNGTGFNPREPVHPTFLYESLWCLAGFLLLHFISKKLYKFNGEIFSLYLVWYGTGRFWIESLRTDSLMLGTMKVSQLVAILTIIGGIAMLFLFKARAQRLPKDLFADEVSIPLDEEAESGGEDAEDTEGEEASEDTGEAEETGEAAETENTPDEPESAVQAEEAVEEAAVDDEAAPAPKTAEAPSPGTAEGEADE